MWQPIIDKMKSQNETERLERLKNDVRAQKDRIAELEKRIEKLEKKNDK